MAMWPELMGSGWEQQLLMAIGILCVVIAALKVLAAAADRPFRDEGPDPLLALWHRYEEGDLTRQEFQRLKRSLRTSPSYGEGESLSPGHLGRGLADRSSSVFR
jgi:hypothetical protein